MAKHRMAVIGLGMAVLPHAKSFIDLADRLEIVVGYSPTQARREAFAEKWKFPVSGDLDAIFADKSIDCVAILTPPNSHRDLVLAAAKAGKHVLLEKPLEISTPRAEDMVKACRAAELTFGVVLQHRFRAPGVKLREILKNGELGKIVSCSTIVPNWRPQTYYDQPGRGTKARDGGGVLITQGIHTMDLMLSIAGDVAEVFAYATTTPVHRMETEDLVGAAVKYKNGALGVIQATTAAYPGFPERIEIICEKGSAAITGTELKAAFHDGRVVEIARDPNEGGTGADPMAFAHDQHRAVIADFLDAIDNKREPAISGQEALRVHRLIDALLLSAASGKTVKVA
jgi:UDP-N-acetyl-2-amino-2-deoxyglucuronate dehydrogenase